MNLVVNWFRPKTNVASFHLLWFHLIITFSVFQAFYVVFKDFVTVFQIIFCFLYIFMVFQMFIILLADDYHFKI